MNYDGQLGIQAYSQIFRDGRLEAAMSDLSYSPDQSGQNGVCFLRDSIVEDGMLRLVQSYLGFCKSIGVDAPIWMFSALIGCEGVRIYTGWGLRGTLNNGVDYSPCYLPEIEITLLDEKPQALLRPWCDMLWQACGMERSFNFDQEGNWRERRR